MRASTFFLIVRAIPRPDLRVDVPVTRTQTHMHAREKRIQMGSAIYRCARLSLSLSLSAAATAAMASDCTTHLVLSPVDCTAAFYQRPAPALALAWLGLVRTMKERESVCVCVSGCVQYKHRKVQPKERGVRDDLAAGHCACDHKRNGAKGLSVWRAVDRRMTRLSLPLFFPIIIIIIMCSQATPSPAAHKCGV